MGDMKISVIIPAYNREKYLEVAVRSVLEQTHSDIEVLIVNDASTDETGPIADRLAQEDNRVRIIHHEQNMYRSGALNTGIDNATGNYLSFLDSDDYYLADKLERQIAFLESHPESDGVYGDFEILLEDNTETTKVSALSSTQEIRGRLAAKANGEEVAVMSEGFIPSCSVLIRKSVFETIRFDANLRNMEDFDMWLQILGMGFVLTRLPGSTYVYRRHDEQKSSDSARMILARGIIEEKMKSGAYLAK
jgi:glycosyltransferase involved in cell wall biosynthesis